MLFRLLNGAMALLFLFGAAVQYNDPDPLPWMAIYIAAAAACALAVAGQLRWWLAATVALVAFAWAAVLAPRAFADVRIAEMFGAWEMANTRIEEGREMYGLLLIAIYMTVLTVLTVVRLRRRSGAA